LRTNFVFLSGLSAWLQGHRENQKRIAAFLVIPRTLADHIRPYRDDADITADIILAFSFWNTLVNRRRYGSSWLAAIPSIPVHTVIRLVIFLDITS